jgi:hypothetical protein
MLDAVRTDIFTVGLVDEIERRPSEVLDAMLSSIQTCADIALEEGHDWIQIEQIRLKGEALRALTANDPNIDVTFGEDEELDEPRVMAMVQEVHDFMDFISEFTPPYTYFGFVSDDPSEDGFNAIGIWPDWTRIRVAVQHERVAELEHPSEFSEYQNEMIEAQYEHALIEDGEDLTLVSVVTGEVEWRW